MTQSQLRRIQGRQWWLWASAATITLLLTLGLASFALSFPQTAGTIFYLLFLVLLFVIHVIYQQSRIHRMHLQLNEQQEIFRLIGENADDMIAVVHTSGQRLYNSPSYQKILGYSPKELAGTTSLEQIHPDDRQIVKEAAEEARRTGLGRRLEYRFRHKNGTWRILESTASVIPNARGEPEKLVIINRDITER